MRGRSTADAVDQLHRQLATVVLTLSNADPDMGAYGR